jgi:hypothetical protein
VLPHLLEVSEYLFLADASGEPLPDALLDLLMHAVLYRAVS